MFRLPVLLGAALMSLSLFHGGAAIAGDEDVAAKLEALAKGDHRSEDNKARNAHRHPVETLSFFGVRPDMTVVEVSPGAGGWYLEILAPFLKDEGAYYAASYNQDDDNERLVKARKRLDDKLAAHPDHYGKVILTEFAPPAKYGLAPSGTADMVLTFRNTHGWMRRGAASKAFAAFYDALKPGGVLGVVQHRADAGSEAHPKAPKGYVKEDYVIKLAEHAGFILVGKSEVNANPKDTKDYENGVWQLPPVLAGEGDKAKYEAIGESDRMTLKFVKP